VVIEPDITYPEAWVTPFKGCVLGEMTSYDETFNYLRLAKLTDSNFVSLINEPLYIKDFIQYVANYRKQEKKFDISLEELKFLEDEFLVHNKEKYTIHKLLRKEEKTNDYVDRIERYNLKDLGEVIASLVSMIMGRDYNFALEDDLIEYKFYVGQKAVIKEGDDVYLELVKTSFKEGEEYVCLAHNISLKRIREYLGSSKLYKNKDKVLMIIFRFLGYVDFYRRENRIQNITKEQLELLKVNFYEMYRKKEEEYVQNNIIPGGFKKSCASNLGYSTGYIHDYARKRRRT